MFGEEIEYRGRIIHLIRAPGGRWSATAWRDAHTVEQLPGGIQFAKTREAALKLACKLVDRQLQPPKLAELISADLFCDDVPRQE